MEELVIESLLASTHHPLNQNLKRFIEQHDEEIILYQAREYSFCVYNGELIPLVLKACS